MDDVRTPDQLLREALAIRDLLDDTAEDDHSVRISLTASQDRVRLEAARQWRARGWRPITESAVVRRPARTLLLAPALAAAGAAVLAHTMSDGGVTVALLTLLAAAPLLAEWAGRPPGRVRRWAGVGALVLALYVVIGTGLATIMFFPAAALLLAIAVTGVQPRSTRSRWPGSV